MKFELHSEFQPTGDQPKAIQELVDGFRAGNQFETLVGVTGSGKTFTMANVIQELQKPTLIISHNKTLAAQLYSEMSSETRSPVAQRSPSIARSRSCFALLPSVSRRKL